MRYFTFFALVALSAMTSAQPAHDVVDGNDGNPGLEFFSLLSQSSDGLERAQTLKQSMDSSDLIVRGYIDYVSEGRIIISRNSDIPPIKTSLIKFEVKSAIKGNPSRFVYIEYITGGMPSESLNYSRYASEVLLFLAPSSGFLANADIENTESAAVISQSNPIYQLTLPSRLFAIEENEFGIPALISPLGLGTLSEGFYRSIRSLDELEEAIKNSL